MDNVQINAECVWCTYKRLKQGLSKYYWRVFMKITVTCLKKQHGILIDFFLCQEQFPKKHSELVKKRHSKSIYICRLWLNLLAEKTGGKAHNLTLIILKVIFLVQRNALRPLISNLTCLSILQDATRSDIQVWYEFHEILEKLTHPIKGVKKAPEILLKMRKPIYYWCYLYHRCYSRIVQP